MEHYLPDIFRSPRRIMCGQHWKVLMKKGFVTPSITLGLKAENRLKSYSLARKLCFLYGHECSSHLVKVSSKKMKRLLFAEYPGSCFFFFFWTWKACQLLNDKKHHNISIINVIHTICVLYYKFFKVMTALLTAFLSFCNSPHSLSL